MKAIKIIVSAGPFVLSLAGATASVISVSIPAGSQDPLCRPSYDNVWTVNIPPFPFDPNRGIGVIINPTWTSLDDNQDFALHQNNAIQPSPRYAALNVPDPSAAIVTYTFDRAEVVSGVEIVQHVNGITEVEGFLGDSTNALVSLGSVFGPSGDITDGTYVVPSDGTVQVFDFGNSSISGTVLQVIIRKTSYPTAFATHRIYPLDASGAPIPLLNAMGWVVGSNGLDHGTRIAFNSTAATPTNLAPRLNAPRLDANGNFQFAVAGAEGARCVIQTSTNLPDWITLLTNTVPFTFTTGKAAGGKLHLYRVIYAP